MKKVEEEEEKDIDYGPLCTFAATGTKPHFQSLYLCHTCAKEDGVPLCLGANCADICHEGHNVEYYGEAIAHCECSIGANNSSKGCNVGCKLIEKSKQIANKLNLHHLNEGKNDFDLGIHVPILRKKDSQFPFVCDVYDVPSIRPCDTLIEQAQELIKHSRETHWVSCRQNNNTDMHDFHDLCELEKLAYLIFQRHLIAYELEHVVGASSNDFGAEWWVQVKETGDDAIDLHYDKDEELASAFDLGSFPTLSTVTYLTEGKFGTNQEGVSISAPPTLVFAHTHEMIDEGPVGQSAFDNGDNDVNEKKKAQTPQLMISHAREGKHLCFDGRLLHGASSDLLLRQFHKEEHEQNRLSRKDGLRVTFLVNIWLSRRPSGITSLQSNIRSKLKSHSKQDGDFLTSPSFQLEMFEREPKSSFIQNGTDRIMLPFVSTDATWIEDENESAEGVSGLVVTLFPPEEQDSTMDTIVALYDEGFEPNLEHLGEDEEYDENDDHDEKVKG